MSTHCVFLLLALPSWFAGHVAARTWPVPYELNGDTLPNLEISLAPPAEPLPEFATAMREQEQEREKAEAANLRGLRKVHRTVLARTDARVGEILGRTLGVLGETAMLGGRLPSKPQSQSVAFLGYRTEPFSADNFVVNIDAHSLQKPNATWTASLSSLGHRRIAKLQRVLDQDVASAEALSSALLEELEAQVRTQVTSILNRSPSAVVGTFGANSFHSSGFVSRAGEDNVHIVAPRESVNAFTSIAQVMESRAGISERLGRWKVLEMELHLLKAQHRIMRERLRGAVRRILPMLGAAPQPPSNSN